MGLSRLSSQTSNVIVYTGNTLSQNTKFNMLQQILVQNRSRIFHTNPHSSEPCGTIQTGRRAVLASVCSHLSCARSHNLNTARWWCHPETFQSWWGVGSWLRGQSWSQDFMVPKHQLYPKRKVLFSSWTFWESHTPQWQFLICLLPTSGYLWWPVSNNIFIHHFN